MSRSLDQFLVPDGVPGYFRRGEESSFPWEQTDRGVWYAVFVVEDGRIEHYGFTSAKGQKRSLCKALKHVLGVREASLIGVWTGQYNTHLFMLDIDVAIKHLEAI